MPNGPFFEVPIILPAGIAVPDGDIEAPAATGGPGLDPDHIRLAGTCGHGG